MFMSCFILLSLNNGWNRPTSTNRASSPMRIRMRGCLGNAATNDETEIPRADCHVVLIESPASTNSDSWRCERSSGCNEVAGEPYKSGSLLLKGHSSTYC